MFAKMKISILCYDPNHPVVKSLREWIEKMTSKGHVVTLVFDKTELHGGDILFLVSCSQMIRDAELDRFKETLVLHASDLPKGRGWSPHIWSILGGANQITVCLFEATESLDSGSVWLKTTFDLEGHELSEEINAKLFASELYLMTQAIERFGYIKPVQQVGNPGKYMKKRTPSDSKIDINKSISEQFNLLRVVDSQRYPAFFEYQGVKYFFKIEKAKSEKSN